MSSPDRDSTGSKRRLEDITNPDAELARKRSVRDLRPERLAVASPAPEPVAGTPVTPSTETPPSTGCQHCIATHNEILQARHQAHEALVAHHQAVAQIHQLNGTVHHLQNEIAHLRSQLENSVRQKYQKVFMVVDERYKEGRRPDDREDREYERTYFSTVDKASEYVRYIERKRWEKRM